MGTESTDGFPGLKGTGVDIVPISSPNHRTTRHEDLSLVKDVAELYLDRVFEKPAAHEFYCPNCNACIKKVVIRPEPDDKFRCTTCFSFLTPIGNWFFPQVVAQHGAILNEQETNTVQVPPPDSSTYKSPSGGTPPLDQNKAPFSEKVHDEDPNASAINQFLSPVDAPQEADRNNIAPSKQDSKLPEVIIDGGRGPEAEPPIIVDSTEGITDSEPRGAKKLEIVKSIVYGGLVESITSLSVVTSAASADAPTLSIVALSLANLIGGVFTIAHNLLDLKSDQQPRGASSLTNEQVDRYQEMLGRRENFLLHATITLLSFLVFGLVPPVVYGFTFMETDDKNFKLAAVAVASLLCITILAIGKAYIQKPPKHYIKTVLQYFVTGIMASGVSYVAGDLAKKLIEKLGWFNSGEAVPMPLAEMSSGRLAWASY
ncbi:unnamed protein product [Dovyalis caffra]|uniref:Membrane protein of ER body-like protein n=1 Tax=Dovyalis caffra TaxID=77055 RepID=A0AAV1SPK3_9ROSI|nr:unnamed protein product [Dovyalis caffra]